MKIHYNKVIQDAGFRFQQKTLRMVFIRTDDVYPLNLESCLHEEKIENGTCRCRFKP